MGNVLDSFADWAKQKRRWPLLFFLVIPGIFKLVQDYFGLPFRATLRHPVFLCSSAASAVAALVLYLALAYSERIRFSATLDRIKTKFKSRAVRLIVSDAVAWHLLIEKTVDGIEMSTLAAVLSEVAADFRVRVVVVKDSSLASLPTCETDGLIFGGKSQPFNLLLKASVIFNQTRRERFDQEASEPMAFPETEAKNVVLTIPPSRFLRSRYLFSHFSPEAPLRIDVHTDNQITVARMVLRCALATMLSYDDNPLVARLFREVVSDAKLLPAIESPALANLLKTSAHYFALRERNVEAAIEALDLGHQFAAADAWIEIVRAYLLLAIGKRLEAAAIIDQIAIDSDSAAAYQQLRGEYFRNIERPEDAIKAYRKALTLITDPDDAPAIHLAIAFAYDKVESIDWQERASKMIMHLQEAINAEPDGAVFYILQGFAWAMKGNSDLSERAFSRGEALATSEDSRNFLEYWRARGTLELGQHEQTIKSLEKRFGNLEEVQDPSLLLVLVKSLIKLGGREAEVEKYLDRILAIGSQEEDVEGEVFRQKGLAIVWRMLAEDLTDAEHRLRLNEEARGFLLKSTRTDDENTHTHFWLGRLYWEAGDPVNATKHARRAAELDPQNLDPLLLLADLAAESGRLEETFEILAAARILVPSDINLEVREGLARRRAGQLETARDVYQQVIKLDPQSEAGHSGLAFVLFDLNEVDDALMHWVAALKINPESADSLAGKAIALSRKGETNAALEAYRTATLRDPSFLNSAKMQDNFLWSSVACRTAEPLISQLDSSQNQRAAG